MSGKGFALRQGDCLDIMRTLPDGCVDLVLADPPYGTTQNKWDSIIPLELMWRSLWKVSKSDAPIIMTAATPFDKILGASQIKYLKYEWIWRKNKASGHLNAKKMPLKDHENVLVFGRKRLVYNPEMTDGHAPMNYAVRSTHTRRTTGHNARLFRMQVRLKDTRRQFWTFPLLITTRVIVNTQPKNP